MIIMLLLSPIFLSTNYMYTNNILEYNNIVRFTVNVVMDLKKKTKRYLGKTLNVRYIKFYLHLILCTLKNLKLKTLI